jgi:hypothetical protein
MATKKSKKKSGPKTVTFTISKACAEELYIAIAIALGPPESDKKKKGGAGKRAFGPTRAGGGLPGLDDTEGRD